LDDSSFLTESMLEMFIFETNQLIEQIEQSVMAGEKSSAFSPHMVNEILRAMHTIKGSSAMMMYDGIATLSHALEDLFYYLRESKPENFDYSALSDLVLEGIDFIKIEIIKLKNGDELDGQAKQLITSVHLFLEQLRIRDGAEAGPKSLKSSSVTVLSNSLEGQIDIPAFQVSLYFDDGCEMENIRAYSVLHNLKDHAEIVRYCPQDILDNDESAEIIRQQGFQIYFHSNESENELLYFFNQTLFLRSLELSAWKEKGIELNDSPGDKVNPTPTTALCGEPAGTQAITASAQQSVISVNVTKLDKLMDLIGELVISEAMVTQNPELKGLELDHFWKSARHLRKITGEIQDMVMSIRMVPLATTFIKMHRIVRDMCKKLDKDIELEILGEETEVDKNIIEHISDPLMHLIRNAIDHGIERPQERLDKGKPALGKITLEARNAGSDVLVVVKDDGKGLDKERILNRARINGLLFKPEEEMTDKEIFSLIFLPGFSTNENVTEFSGRGVGMDVVTRNIEAVGGSVSVDSTPGAGSVIYIKIPLTLAIIDGMNIRVGRARYTLPMISIKESFRVRDEEVFSDPDGYEMMMVRGQCFPVKRLHTLYNVEQAVTRISEGIIIMVESEHEMCCLFADELLGEQQVVVKALPGYIRNMKLISGLAGCTLLGDGSISLILDVTGLISKTKDMRKAT
jgi:two-component system chemotaxis sensor kinase CheA